MVKDIILQHKKEKEDLLSKNYVVREKLDVAYNFLEKDLIKIIMGPRRAGKSIFSILLLRNKNFSYINFDDENLVKIDNTDEIMKAIIQVYAKPEFLFFDEIQNLKNWELFVNKLQRRGYNVILTGSNANLLNKELASVLTGRHIPIEILPFSFKEYLQARNVVINPDEYEIPEIKGILLKHLEEYLTIGGFPELVVKNIDPKTYLGTLFDSILFKDVVKKYKVRYAQKIYDLAMYIVSNFSKEYSYTKLKNILNFSSVITIQNYLKYLNEAYLTFPLNRFSFKLKEQIKTAKKNYLIDNGFIGAKAFQFSPNIGRLMENIVFVELVRRAYYAHHRIYYYKTRNSREIDFVLKVGNTINSLIQVLFHTSDEEKENNEIKSLLEASEELHCNTLMIITWDKEKQLTREGKTIVIIPLLKWLLNLVIL